MKKLTLFILTYFAVAAYGQSDVEKAYDLGMQAIQEIDKGNTKEAIQMLQECIKLDPDHYLYPYEIALAHYIDKNYKESIKILKLLTKHKDADGQTYQLLGNAYDMAKKRKTAIATYDKGLELFPDAGVLYLERGNMELANNDVLNALEYYEKGIKVDPEFPSNYYWATKIYLISTEKVWGMIYGEIFMNLERNSRRTQEISKLLYDTYKNEIVFSDSGASVSFSKYSSINIEDVSDLENIKLPFGIGIYETTLLVSLVSESGINLSSIDRIRTKFIEYYYLNKHNRNYPNVLFDFQKQLIDLGYFESYNHWLLMIGDEEAFVRWKANNGEKFEEFIDWFIENPLNITKEKCFHSNQYF